MKAFNFTSILFLILSYTAIAQSDKPIILGKIVKTEKEIQGSRYFVTYKKNKKNLAYPIKNPPKNVDKHIGKLVRVWGKPEFLKSDFKESKYIMFFNVSKIKPLGMKELGLGSDALDDSLFAKIADTEKKSNITGSVGLTPSGMVTGELVIDEIDDDVANTTIFIGGAIIANEVLKAFASAK